MKQVTYIIRGMVTEPMIPAITASCESLVDVKSVTVDVRDADTAALTLTLEGEPTPAIEQGVASVLRAKGLEISGTESAEVETPVAPAQDAPKAEEPAEEPNDGE